MCYYLQVPKGSSNLSSSDSDKSTELPNMIVPETVPHDFTIVESDENDEEQITVKEKKSGRYARY